MRPRLCSLLGCLIAALAFIRPLSAQTLTVAAAANLKAAMDAFKPTFEARHPGATLQICLGASGSLLAQIQQGAPFDVFLAADAEFPDKVVAAGLASGRPFPYATGRLTLWLRKDLGLSPEKEGLKVLLNPAVKRIAIANPATAPFGRSAEAALKAAGLYDTLKPRLVFGENIGQAAQYLQTGAAEAGLVSSPQVMVPALAHGLAWTVPQHLYPVQKQCGVLLKRSAQPALAAAFRDELLGAEAQALFAKLGYGAP